MKVGGEGRRGEVMLRCGKQVREAAYGYVKLNFVTDIYGLFISVLGQVITTSMCVAVIVVRYLTFILCCGHFFCSRLPGLSRVVRFVH